MTYCRKQKLVCAYIASKEAGQERKSRPADLRLTEGINLNFRSQMDPSQGPQARFCISPHLLSPGANGLSAVGPAVPIKPLDCRIYKLVPYTKSQFGVSLHSPALVTKKHNNATRHTGVV